MSVALLDLGTAQIFANQALDGDRGQDVLLRV
jgi:hypothetical protein